YRHSRHREHDGPRKARTIVHESAAAGEQEIVDDRLLAASRSNVGGYSQVSWHDGTSWPFSRQSAARMPNRIRRRYTISVNLANAFDTRLAVRGYEDACAWLSLQKKVYPLAVARKI